jgi:hypothetical protein
MTGGLNVDSETPCWEVLVDQALWAARIHERATRIRQFVILCGLTLSIATLLFPADFAALRGAVVDSPAALGIWLFASFFTIALERSTRVQRDDCFGKCERFGESSEQLLGVWE